jgi:hypothetical protein
MLTRAPLFCLNDCSIEWKKALGSWRCHNDCIIEGKKVLR